MGQWLGEFVAGTLVAPIPVFVIGGVLSFLAFFLRGVLPPSLWTRRYDPLAFAMLLVGACVPLVGLLLGEIAENGMYLGWWFGATTLALVLNRGDDHEDRAAQARVSAEVVARRGRA